MACQADDPMDCEDDDQETYFQVDNRIRVKPEFMTTLELNSTTITQYLKPFKSQLTQLYLSNLAEFDELRPYLAISSKKSGETDSSEGEPYPIDGDITLHQRRSRAVTNTKVFYYPLTEQQIYILDQFRQAQTLIFTSLPSQDCIIKLIALTILVSQPYYNQVLFPNVKKVIYSSAMQEKSLVERYAYLGSTFIPHPITFALDWLVNDFSLCIHSASSTFRAQWIETRVKNDASYDIRENLEAKYKEKWLTLNPLSGTVFIDKLPGLRTISYHNVLPGDRPRFTSSIETYIYFGLHQDLDNCALGITLKAMARSTLQGNDSQIPIIDSLHLIDIENLSVATVKKNGPKAKEQQLIRREDMLKMLLRQLMRSYESGGRELVKTDATYLYGKLEKAGNTSTYDMTCLVCGNCCVDAICSEQYSTRQGKLIRRSIRHHPFDSD